MGTRYRRVCRHCARQCMDCGRGLCGSCYTNRDIRKMYPPLRDTMSTEALGRENREPPLPAAPTTALPGTTRKMFVMQRRLMAGQAIFHPLDHDPSTEL